MIIKLSTSGSDWPLARQTPGGTGIWNGVTFVIDALVERCDAWIVGGGLDHEDATDCPPDRVILATWEPPMVKEYDPRYLAQFAAVLTCHKSIHHGILGQQGLPWHAGVRRRGGELDRDMVRFGYDHFAASALLAKTKDLSVVCSAKSDQRGHRRRIAFVQALKAHFGERLDWFGRGFIPIDDKWDAIAPYRFHLALENSRVPHYWTEKLADCYLGGAFPLYYGCPNLDRYFDPRAFAPVDLRDPRGAIRIVERLLSEGLTEDRQAALLEAKRRVLDEYNLFPTFAKLALDRPAGAPRRIALKPESAYPPSTSLFARVRRKWRSFRG